jgi:NAD(P)-dependent dehydrogenase (short-subunit alcohol dehydrogenase family)
MSSPLHRDRVAIVTGGASGIGFALAEKAIQCGMHAVIADINGAAITEAEAKLAAAARANGVDVFGFAVDVSSVEHVGEFADAVARRFPGKPISLLCCNAGVGGGGPVLQASDMDWDFVLGVNVKGVANCLRAFVPGMLTQGAPGSIVTTASQDGLCAAQGVYGVSKHACVALTEAVHGEVRDQLSVHVLCPNVVATNIVKSGLRRPERFGGPQEMSEEGTAAQDKITERFKEFGIPPSDCADQVFDSIRTGVFYILAEHADDPGYVRLEAETRKNAILNGTRPYRPKSAFVSKVFGR